MLKEKTKYLVADTLASFLVILMFGIPFYMAVSNYYDIKEELYEPSQIFIETDPFYADWTG